MEYLLLDQINTKEEVCEDARSANQALIVQHARSKTGIREFSLLLGRWCQEAGVTRDNYAALLEIWGTLKDIGEIRLLPKSLSTLKRNFQAQFPLVKRLETLLQLDQRHVYFGWDWGESERSRSKDCITLLVFQSCSDQAVIWGISQSKTIWHLRRSTNAHSFPWDATPEEYYEIMRSDKFDYMSGSVVQSYWTKQIGSGWDWRGHWTAQLIRDNLTS